MRNCYFGMDCNRQGCIFNHVPLPKEDCKFGLQCKNSKCKREHPEGFIPSHLQECPFYYKSHCTYKKCTRIHFPEENAQVRTTTPAAYPECEPFIPPYSDSLWARKQAEVKKMREEAEERAKKAEEQQKRDYLDYCASKDCNKGVGCFMNDCPFKHPKERVKLSDQMCRFGSFCNRIDECPRRHS